MIMKPWQRPKSQRRSMGLGNTSSSSSPFDNVVIVTGGSGNKEEDQELALTKLIKQAKESGKLALNNRALELLPQVLFSSYEVGKREVIIDMGSSTQEDSQSSNWWEGEPLLKLFLSDNSLATIPDKFATTFPELITLDLHGNKLSNLPDNLELCKGLTTLNLSRNEFSSIPSCVTKLPLTELQLAHNQLSYSQPLSDSSEFLGNLTQLNLSHNKLKVFPFQLDQLPKLRTLNLGYNQITSLPESFIGCPLLEDLDLSHNRLQKLPFFPTDLIHSNPAQFPKLNSINLQMNRLLSIDFHPESALPALKHLLLSNNLLISLGKVLDSLPQLVVLTMAENRLDTFPDGILKMADLAQLDLTRNNLNRIPPQIGNLGSLNTLIITGNPLRGVPRMTTTQEFLEAMRNRIPTVSPPSSQVTKGETQSDDSSKAPTPLESSTPSLKLSNQEISSRTVRLTNLKIDDTELESKLSDPLPFSPKHFEFNKNVLTRAPTPVLDLYHESLTSLNLAMNHLTSFELHQPLPNLVHLNLGGNRLTAFPLLQEGTPLCPRLDTLDLSMNRIPTLPQAPSDNFPILSSLMMSNNQVADITISLPFITSLVHFDISNNNVKQVPPQLAAPGSKLIGIELTGNPFLFPRYQVLARGSAHVLEYLKSRIPAPQ